MVSIPEPDGSRSYHGVRDATALQLAASFGVTSEALRALRRAYLDNRDGAALVVVHLDPHRVIAERITAPTGQAN